MVLLSGQAVGPLFTSAVNMTGGKCPCLFTVEEVVKIVKAVSYKLMSHQSSFLSCDSNTEVS